MVYLKLLISSNNQLGPMSNFKAEGTKLEFSPIKKNVVVQLQSKV